MDSSNRGKQDLLTFLLVADQKLKELGSVPFASFRVTITKHIPQTSFSNSYISTFENSYQKQVRFPTVWLNKNKTQLNHTENKRVGEATCKHFQQTKIKRKTSGIIKNTNHGHIWNHLYLNHNIENNACFLLSSYKTIT